MIEIYLFIHPLCRHCLASEKEILNLVELEQKKIQFRFIPLLNLKSFQSFWDSQQLGETASIAQRNQFFIDSYAAALDYKAIQLQGKRIGRAFLLELQEAICLDEVSYSEKLVHFLLEKIGADQEMFANDRQSSLVKKSFEADQITAKEMNVTQKSAAVIFDYSCENDFGILIEDHLSLELLQHILQEGPLPESITEKLPYGIQNAHFNYKRANHKKFLLLQNKQKNN